MANRKNLSERPVLTVTKADVYRFPCPACSKTIQANHPRPDVPIDCSCGNKTWGPTYAPKWYATALEITNKTVVALAVTGIGFLVKLVWNLVTP